MVDVVKVRLENMPWEIVRDDFRRRIVTGEKLMVAQLSISKGGKVAMHKHVHEQFTVVLEGSIKFVFETGLEFVAQKGEIVVIPSNVGHAAEAIEDTITFDIFAPPREDWLTGRDDYLRQKT
ncbi:MAG: cupin domain-containing protein [Candidatus Caldarchaeum sp.]|nr:cupin domain-containing protein [Candidatus Caldarchaeum sp.]MCS7133675.1 cupin domain-containing protein [Candidatus Caldarchaeum sp.]MCX8201261.1 cupin domain-containing protein [Candidatus Caldarchaeum sp.]MDW8434893.1 cupin domain-containing protein [Candidatus Caldarchaeum sp.]